MALKDRRLRKTSDEEPACSVKRGRLKELKIDLPVMRQPRVTKFVFSQPR